MIQKFIFSFLLKDLVSLVKKSLKKKLY